MIDNRGFQAFLDELLRRIDAELPAWEAATDDVGSGLAAVHAHFLEILVDRLNRVPDKDQMAFLDLVGVSRLAPAAATVPVSFTLAPTAGQAAAVERGTQLATQQTETLPPVVFETVSGLNVVAARLEEAHVVDPERDRWMDVTPVLTGAQGRPFAVFRGERPLLHALHLGHPRLLDVRHPAKLQIALVIRGELQDTVWEVSTDAGWAPLAAERDGTCWRFTPFAGAAPLTLRGAGLDGERPGRWLRWRLAEALTEDAVTVEGLAATLSTLPPRLGLTRDLSGPSPARLMPAAVAGTRLAAEAKAQDRTLALASQAFSVKTPLLIRSTAGEEPAMVEQVNANRVTLTRDLELTHPQGAFVFALIPQLVPYDNAEDHVTGLEVGDWLKDDHDVARVQAIDAGVAPDHVLVNTAPADATKPFEAFGPLPKLGDALHIASADAFVLPDPAAATAATLDVTVRVTDAQLNWSDGVTDDTHGFTRDGTIEIPAGGGDRTMTVTLVAGGYQRVPAIASLRARNGKQIDVWASPSPDANTRGRALDLQSPMLPFGTTPAPGATFTITVKGGGATIDVTLVAPPQLAWEYLAPSGWTSLAVTDGTRAFTRSGRVEFDVPPDLQPADLNGMVAPWVRARIAGGAYGRALEFVMADPADPKAGFLPRQGTGALNPPLISRLALDYKTTCTPLELLTRNDFAWNAPATPFEPFRPPADAHAALYLRFDRALPDSGARVHAVAPLRQVTEAFDPAPPLAGDEEAQLAWEHWDGRAWVPLTIADHTARLTESGGIEIVGVGRMAALARTAPDLPAGAAPVTGHWVRVRRAAGGPGYDPSLTHLLLNTVEAAQAATVRDEILGSSGGGRDETFRTSRRPVLPGQTIVVREPERPPAAEGALVGAAEGPFDVEWEEVPTLAASRAHDRHYTIERHTGTIRFGNGRQGLIPPAGADNVICREYRAGGGAEGNQGAGAVAQLKTSIPYVASVVNAVPAGGGSAPEATAQVKARGPQTLRHRDRAVSADDFEWLARAAAGTGVAKARTLSNRDRDLRFAPGWTTVVIVPEGSERRPLPSAGLVDAVQEALDDRCLATLSAGTSRVNVVGPGYVPVDVRVAVVPRDFSEGEATRRDVLKALEDFLHPLRGGPDGEGWPLGRAVYLSELSAALERIPRVDHVSLLEFLPSVGALALRVDEAPAPVEFAVGSVLEGAGVRGRLARAIPAGAPIDAAHAVLFQESERLRIEDAAETTVRTISGSLLAVDPFTPAETIAAGARVIAVERTTGPQPRPHTERFATLAEPLAAGQLVDRLHVRAIEPGDELELRRAVEPEPDPSAGPQPLPVAFLTVRGLDSRLRVADAQLPYSGTHQIELSGT